MKRVICLLALCSALFAEDLKVRITWGHESPAAASYYIRLAPETSGLEIRNAAGYQLEPGEGLKGDAWQSTAGAGDIDGVTFTLAYPQPSAARLQNLHIIWADLIAESDADTAMRLSRDAAFHPDAPKLTVYMNPEGTRGFTVSVDQLVQEKALWVPSLHVYVAAGERPASFEDHQKGLAEWKGKRILDRVEKEPEASYAQYTARWEDMGSPAYTRQNQPAPGHIVGLTWDSAIAKFGIDRGAGVWNDYGNPDHFRFWFDFGDLTKGILQTWKSQSLKDGLPVITTVFEKDAARYEVEQFAYPLHGPPGERRGDIPMVLLQKVKVTDLSGKARLIPIAMTHRRQFPAFVHTDVVLEHQGGAQLLSESAFHNVLFSVEGLDSEVEWNGTHDYQREEKRVDATAVLHVPANGTREFVVKLPSPMVKAADALTLAAIDYSAARQATLDFWSGWIKRGAQFHVPEEAVNELYRATLWHALRLPRRHGGQQEGVQIDLPYSNFAYSQTGTPWPVNQAVYVDYMLYGLRGYHDVAVEEMLAEYRNNQEYSGHVNGYANWVSNTPGMLYTVAQDYFLYRDRKALDRLMPYTLKALDWCLQEVREANQRSGAAHGLVVGPLNDGTGEGAWAFNQAYMYAALERFGQMLEAIGNSRAGEALAAAHELHTAIGQAFEKAAAKSTLVELRDHTWIPYVPSEAFSYHRILDQWYPTDVDTGAVHLLRLKAVPANGEIADSLLNDHEDNLYLNGWGMANEPVYNQQGTAYLLRDDPKAAIRTFYSYMASAFSHSVFEPVEHRWTHGQYFGPPSTDGAWCELYRNMLVREVDDHTLLIGQATPRKWLEDGSKIEVQRAPTYFGPVSYLIESHARGGKISATVEFPAASRPQTLLIRFRHPDAKPIRSVTLDGQDWKDFDAAKEWVRIPNPSQARYTLSASY
ncbi:MAG TPA: hypothetical protein VJN43_07375 [Bryobacteraceae bacterium]|nr:hypothetical protein [Bryobacteraceae bacterium]